MNLDPSQCYNKGDIINYCNTINGENCIQLDSGWYYTYDKTKVSNYPQINAPVPNNGIPGFYCYSKDSYNCLQTNGPNCNLTNFALCALDA